MGTGFRVYFLGFGVSILLGYGGVVGDWGLE